MSKIEAPYMSMIGDRYRIVEQLGEGGMGIVYKCDDTYTGNPVAIKMLKPQMVASGSEGLERFKREADALYQIDHPNIVRVLDTVYHDELYFIVMEYIDGGSLRKVLEQVKRLPIVDVLNISLDLSDALIRTHRVKIVHRDVKPDNVLLTSAGVPRLTDFGASYMANASALTMSGSFIGTMSYSAPEVMRGEKAEPAADIWSFGVMIYEMLSGFRPFMGGNYRELIFAVTKQPVPDLLKLRQDCPPEFANVIYAMLEKNKNDRIQSMRQVGAYIEEVLASL